MKLMRQCGLGTMSSNRRKQFLVSTISDKPSKIFEHLSHFEREPFEGLHFDIMDGIFVPRLGLYPELLGEIRQKSSIFIEAHVMLVKPSQYLESIANSGANRVVFHLETKEDIGELIVRAKNLGLRVGLALNIETDVKGVIPYLEDIEIVMLMAIIPGIPKHPFLEITFKRLQDLMQLINQHNPSVAISIDGGVVFENVSTLFELGADRLVCGSGTVFSEEGTITRNIDKLFSQYSKRFDL
jgi:ribulose-phosphate 3-epimerase